MPDQSGYQAHDAPVLTSQTRPASRILSPTSENALNVNQTLAGTLKKRKRDAETMEDLLDDAFVVKPYPSTVFDKPRTLRPVALLPRIDLPLACLDWTSTSSTLLPSAQQYEAHIKILELEQRMGSTPMVVLARLDDGKTFYAAERIARGRYALCKLGSWVDLNEMCASAIITRQLPQKLPLPKPASILSESSRETPKIGESTKYERKKRLAIEAIQSLVKRPSVEKASPKPEVAPVASQTFVPQSTTPQDLRDDTLGQEDPVAKPKATDIFESIHGHYLEALYLSKASLAYFAKGPLSRARAAFHLDYDSTLDMNELIAFLESIVLSTTVLDKKYKDGVPNLVSTFDPGTQSGDEADNGNSSKQRKNRKIKLGKKGFYPTEESFIRRWWNTRQTDVEIGGPGVTLENVAKERISQLRIRETQLQIIVILEALALQPLVPAAKTQSGELPSVGSTDQGPDTKVPVSSKAKKPKDLSAMLDIHVDRLCIWQSVAAEGGSSSNVPQTGDGSALSKSSSGNGKHVSDILREFCVEVIVPFFSSRLPSQCKALNRKLGGPTHHSPARSKSTKSKTSSSTSSRPGAVTKRAVPEKSRRSLQRVLTDDRLGRSTSRGPSGAISLMRSATEPMIPGFKREDSETPSLSSIQSADSQALLASRAGIQKSKKFSQREVDLNFLGAGSDSKTKKPNIEAELKDAIAALKRPNRQLAGQSFVELAEQRASAIQISKNKSGARRSSQHPLFQSVQIMATPKPNRRKNIAPEPMPIEGTAPEMDADLLTLPPSSESIVLQSGMRVQKLENSILQETPSRPSLEATKYASIQATPSKGSSQLMSPSRNAARNGVQHGRGDIPDSPFPSRRNHCEIPHTPVKIHSTPVKQMGLKPDRSYRSSESLGPFKTVASLERMQGIPSMEVVTVPSASANDENIYEALGWNDIDEIL